MGYKLSDEEIHSLNTILVRDNDRVVGIKITSGYIGIGGTNQSGFSAESEHIYRAEELSKRKPIDVNGAKICGLVNDLLYLSCKEGGTHTLDRHNKERLYIGDCIGYDTATATKVILLFKEDL